MNSNQNENARTTEDTRRKTSTAAKTINVFFSILKRRCTDRRQLKINDTYKEQIEYNTKRGRSDSRRHLKKDEKCSRNNK